MSGESSPISSRKSVPPSASSKRPTFTPVAPVKAPFSWPNSSLSMSVGGRAAQLTLTRGPCRRGLRSWIAWARSSLPVPVSPRSSTALVVGATWATFARTSRMAGLWPTIASNPFSRRISVRR